MTAAPRIDHYDWARGREAILRWGPDDGPVVAVALPLFEEANRTRAFAAALCRALAALGVGAVLPDLPGQGESLVETEGATLADLRAAFARVPASHALAIRSGALLIGGRPAWLLAPQDGPTLLRELRRVAGGALDGERVMVAGNVLSRALVAELAGERLPGEGRGPVAINHLAELSPSPSATPQLGPGLRRGSGRVVRLAGDPRPADRHVEGEPLWRRAEPDNDLGLVQRLAADIAEWIGTCGG